MRLLRLWRNSFQLHSFNDNDVPPYAILSHICTEGEEVTHKDVIAGIGKEKIGYFELRFCCEQAAEDGLDYFWIGTCCINTTSSLELGEAVSLMFELHNLDRCLAVIQWRRFYLGSMVCT